MVGTAYETFFIEEDHEGIVSRELWDRVQERIARETKRKEKGIVVNYNTHFLYGRMVCGECGEYLTRKTYTRKTGTLKSWVCKDRAKGKNGNGCKNLIVPEEDLMENLTEALGLPWKGVENVNEKDFEILKAVRIFEDGRIEIELNEEKKTA